MTSTVTINDARRVVLHRRIRLIVAATIGYNAIEAPPVPGTPPVCEVNGPGPGADDTRGDILIVSAFTVGGDSDACILRALLRAFRLGSIPCSASGETMRCAIRVAPGTPRAAREKDRVP